MKSNSNANDVERERGKPNNLSSGSNACVIFILVYVLSTTRRKKNDRVLFHATTTFSNAANIEVN